MVLGHFHEDLSRVAPIKGPSERNFGLTIGSVCALVGGLRYWSAASSAVYWFVVAGVLLVLAAARPRILRPLNRLWFRLSLGLHAIVNPLVMAILFCLVVTPIALLMRMTGRYPLRLDVEPDAASYWIERRPPGPAPNTMTRQF
jgi:hypothetical protein